MFSLGESITDNAKIVLLKPEEVKKKKLFGFLRQKSYEKRIFRKDFNHAELIGEELCNIRNLRCAHFFLIGEGYYQVNREAPFRDISDQGYQLKLGSYDLTGCIMLSGETAMGKYPVECVDDMVKISEAIEDDLKYWKRFKERGNIAIPGNLKSNIAYSACHTAAGINASAIVAYTHSGETVNFLSGYRPACPIVGITDDKKTFNKLSISHNVMPVYIEPAENIDKTIEIGIRQLEERGILSKGDTIVIAGGNKMKPLDKESEVIGGIMII